MQKLNDETKKIMDERFGKDSVIAVATETGHVPHVRMVDALYEDGSFYTITYALSNKMRQIAENPAVAVCGEWFTAHGRAEDLGYVRDERNAKLAAKLRSAFAAWYDNGHTNEDDPNTHILRVRLSDGVLTSGGRRYEIDFAG